MNKNYFFPSLQKHNWGNYRLRGLNARYRRILRKERKKDEIVGEGLLAEKRKAIIAKNEDKLRELCEIEGWDFDQVFNQFK